MKHDSAHAQQKLIAERLENWRKVDDATQEKIRPGLEVFLDSLAKEGERSAVVLGAERLSVSLGMLLKAFMRPSPSPKDDSLFDGNRPLASFSSRIELAFRLGLIDVRFRDALNMIRKLRNDFAHAITVETLEKGVHANRLHALTKLVRKGNACQWSNFESVFGAAGPHAKNYLTCIITLLIKLELVRHHLNPPEIFLPALLDYGNR